MLDLIEALLGVRGMRTISTPLHVCKTTERGDTDDTTVVGSGIVDDADVLSMKSADIYRKEVEVGETC
jgi:hypothetical protein